MKLDLTGKNKAMIKFLLRDYFAGRVLPLLRPGKMDLRDKTLDQILEAWAKAAYKVADAMLEVRGNP